MEQKSLRNTVLKQKQVNCHMNFFLGPDDVIKNRLTSPSCDITPKKFKPKTSKYFKNLNFVHLQKVKIAF